MSNVERVAYLRQYILDSLPDKEKVLFDEYNELVVNMITDLRDLNERQNKFLNAVANRSEN